MSEMHPNDLTLLRIAIPQDGEGVPEDILLHVCQCSVCMEKVRNARRMSDIECFLAEPSNNVFQERKEDIKTRPIALYGAGPTEYVPGDAAILACAAAMAPASAMAADYLDSDNVASALTDLEDDSDILAVSDEDFDFDFGDIVDTIDDFFSDN